MYGESFLVKQAFNTLSFFLLGKENRQFAMETLEGGSVSMGDIIEQVSTFSFLVSKKMVVVKNIPLFQPPGNNMETGFSASDIERLMTFIEKGIPDQHYLILISRAVDKRKKIYKAIFDKGVIIDCAVAQGARKADLDEQKAVLQTVSKRILSVAGKTIDPHAFHALVALTGFNLDLLSQNLEKLIAYSGNATMISMADIRAVVKRDKKDPIFNLTNALMAKDVKNALFYLNSLFNEGYHVLQILKSFENQIRKLILVKCFMLTKDEINKTNLRQMDFNSFKLRMLPKIMQDDEKTKAMIAEQVSYGTNEISKKKSNKSNDLFLAPNPQNAYPVFQTFQKSENFSLNELNQALVFLSDLDYGLKSSSFDANTAIESFIINICSKGGFVYAPENKNRRHHF